MASIAWPLASTIKALQDGYSEVPGNNTIRFQPDVGPAQLRRRSTSAPSRMSVRYQLSATDASTLSDFYAYTSVGGTLRFNYTHPRLGTTVEARFLEPPQMSSKDLDAVVSLSLEIMP